MGAGRRSEQERANAEDAASARKSAATRLNSGATTPSGLDASRNAAGKRPNRRARQHRKLQTLAELLDEFGRPEKG